MLFPMLDRWRALDAHKVACAVVGLTDYRLHDARHNYAVTAIKHGASLEHVAKRLGHGSTQMVTSTYGRYVPTHDERRAWSGIFHSPKQLPTHDVQDVGAHPLAAVCPLRAVPRAWRQDQTHAGRVRHDRVCDLRRLPQGIPGEICREEHDHRFPFKGDRGVSYEPRIETPDQEEWRGAP
jgi:hypothetical protein